MSPSPLDLVWWSSDVELPAFTAEEIAFWPDGTFETLSSCGLVREWRTATHVVCADCGGRHVAEVTRLSYPDGAARFFAVCPAHGRVQVEDCQLLQWTIDFDPMLDCLGRDLGVVGAAIEVVPARLWKIGRSTLAGAYRPVWVGRGLSWPDAASLADDLPTGRSPVLIYMGRPPREELVGLGPDSVIDAAEVMAIDDGVLVFDRQSIEEQLSTQIPNVKKRTPRKRASRTAAMAALKIAIREHLVAARDHAYSLLDRDQAPELLPRPTQKLLARQLHLSRSSVCRALADGNDKELAILWEAANHLDLVMRFKDP